MTLWLDRDGWDTATWLLSNPPTGGGDTEVQFTDDGDWYTLTVDGSVASIQVCGPDYDPPVGGADGPPIEDCTVITADCLPRVRVRGVPRTDSWIRLR